MRLICLLLERISNKEMHKQSLLHKIRVAVIQKTLQWKKLQSGK
jgi:hypothetical protein